MNRRGMLAALLALGAPRLGIGQSARKIPRVGVLFVASMASTSSILEGLRSNLRSAGYVEGRTIELDFRSADGRVERLPELARQLVARNVDVILTGGGNASTLAARNATKSIPIVMAGGIDAVEAGLITSLARPGGNVTGLTVPSDLGKKQLELLRELVPSLARVAVLTRPDTAAAIRRAQGKAMLLEYFQLALDFVEVRDPEDLAQALAAVRASRPNALVVTPDPLFFQLREQIFEFARAARLPVMYPLRDFVEAGGFISYSLSTVEVARNLARYLDKILKGAKPADLPVEEPREYELVINLKTAKALGISVPQLLLVRAHEVIQ